MLKLRILHPLGQQNIEIIPANPVRNLKMLLGIKYHYEQSNMKLIYKGKELEDNDLLENCLEDNALIRISFTKTNRIIIYYPFQNKLKSKEVYIDQKICTLKKELTEDLKLKFDNYILMSLGQYLSEEKTVEQVGLQNGNVVVLIHKV